MHSHHVGKTATHVGKTATHVGQVQDAAVCHGEQRLGRTSLPCLLKCITFAQPKHTACTTTCQMTCHRGCHQPSTPLSPQLPSTRHVASAWSQASRSAGDPLWCQCGGHHWEFDASYGKHRARRLEGGDHAACRRVEVVSKFWWIRLMRMSKWFFQVAQFMDQDRECSGEGHAS